MIWLGDNVVASGIDNPEDTSGESGSESDRCNIGEQEFSLETSTGLEVGDGVRSYSGTRENGFLCGDLLLVSRSTASISSKGFSKIR